LLASSAGIPVAAPIQPIPFVPLTEEQQTSLSKAALVRILEGHKTIAAAGGGDLRVALLARLVTQAISLPLPVPLFVEFEIILSIFRQNFTSYLQVFCFSY
jgi:hypothetical protein